MYNTHTVHQAYIGAVPAPTNDVATLPSLLCLWLLRREEPGQLRKPKSVLWVVWVLWDEWGGGWGGAHKLVPART